MLFDLVYKIPRSLIFWSDCLNFVIKKTSLSYFDNHSKRFLVFEDLYLLSLIWHLLFHWSLVCLIILITLKYLYHIDSNNLVYFWTMFYSTSLSKIIVVSGFSKALMRSTMKFFFCSLFLIIVQYSSWINSLSMKMLTIHRAWSDRNQSSGYMMWLLSSLELWCKKNKSITKLLLLILLEYLVGTCWSWEDKQKLYESTISSKELL